MQNKCLFDATSLKRIAVFLWHNSLLPQRQFYDLLHAQSDADIHRLWTTHRFRVQPDEAISGGREILSEYRQAHISIVTYRDDAYPERLRPVLDMPPILAIKGNPALLNCPQIAIVGSRNLHPDSPRICRNVSEYLIQKGFIMTSGGALGIDALAHRTAMSMRMPTIVVCGTGPDKQYPPENKDIYEYAEAYGAVVSQFPIHTPAKTHNFPIRNSLIAALSEATVIIQCREGSGALHTAKYAKKFRRPVLVTAMTGFDPLTEGSLGLVKKGQAQLINCLQDLDQICDAPSLDRFFTQRELFQQESVPEEHIQQELSTQDKILHMLEKNPMTREQVRSAVDENSADLDELLLELELSGKIIQSCGSFRKCWPSAPYPVSG